METTRDMVAGAPESTSSGRKSLSLARVIGYLIATLRKWAQTGQFGEIRIVVQGGQIAFVHEQRAFRDGLPDSTEGIGPAADLSKILES